MLNLKCDRKDWDECEKIYCEFHLNTEIWKWKFKIEIEIILAGFDVVLLSNVQLLSCEFWYRAIPMFVCLNKFIYKSKFVTFWSTKQISNFNQFTIYEPEIYKVKSFQVCNLIRFDRVKTLSPFPHYQVWLPATSRFSISLKLVGATWERCTRPTFSFSLSSFSSWYTWENSLSKCTNTLKCLSKFKDRKQCQFHS